MISKNENNGHDNKSGKNAEGLKFKQRSVGNEEKMKMKVREEDTK